MEGWLPKVTQWASGNSCNYNPGLELGLESSPALCPVEPAGMMYLTPFPVLCQWRYWFGCGTNLKVGSYLHCALKKIKTDLREVPIKIQQLSLGKNSFNLVVLDTLSNVLSVFSQSFPLYFFCSPTLWSVLCSLIMIVVPLALLASLPFLGVLSSVLSNVWLIENEAD